MKLFHIQTITKHATALLCIPLVACTMPSDLPRNMVLPPFTPPNVPAFTCVSESSKMPPPDAQAEAWFREAYALADPDLPDITRDNKKIIQLTQQAAKRGHGKAMLSLATIYQFPDDDTPRRGPKDAIKLVEDAMQLGMPAAYHRMGTYYMDGTAVPVNKEKAYAFWQKAAEMGSPEAMTELATVLSTKQNNTIGNDLINLSVATKMLECAMGQGYGNAAVQLQQIISVPKGPHGEVLGPMTNETDDRGRKILQDGLKLGCAECASVLQIMFNLDDEFNNTHVGAFRARRYGSLYQDLQYNSRHRFPNLDKIVPLPPADLPPWDEDYGILIDTAMGVSPPKPTSEAPSMVGAGCKFTECKEWK